MADIDNPGHLWPIGAFAGMNNTCATKDLTLLKLEPHEFTVLQAMQAQYRILQSLRKGGNGYRKPTETQEQAVLRQIHVLRGMKYALDAPMGPNSSILFDRLQAEAAANGTLENGRFPSEALPDIFRESGHWQALLY